MEERRNITLSLPKDILRKAKIIAVNRDTSVSGLVAEALTDLVRREDAYSQARGRHIALLQHAADLGSRGNLRFVREDLHDRRG